MYEDKQEWYYAFVRKDIAPLLPQHADHVLEIGCGGGATLAWLKETGKVSRTSGIELSPEAGAVAGKRIDQILVGDADQHLASFADGSLDLILCLDVLEHLVDPWVTMRTICSKLRPGGQIIASLPNIRHHSVVLPLLFKGKWQYEEAGIMDRTHLRFFSHDTAVELMTQAGLKQVGQASNYAWGSWDGWKDKLTLGLFNELLSFQYLISAQRPLDLITLPTASTAATAANTESALAQA